MGKAFNLCIVSGSEKVLEFILFRGMGICDLGELVGEVVLHRISNTNILLIMHFDFISII